MGSSIRVRVTAMAVAVVGVALLAGGAVFVALLRDRLVDDVRNAALLQAVRLATALDAGAPPRAVVPTLDDDVIVEVVDDRGLVVASSLAGDRSRPVARVATGGSVTVSVAGQDERFVVVAVPARDRQVLVGHALDDVADSTATATRLLALGLPVLLALVGVTTWTAVGRALAPVDAIRREVDAISASELHRRVPASGRDDEIGRLATTMNHMLERLERSHVRQRRLVSDASHELRSPVASIRQHAEVALAHADRTDVRELAGAVLAEDLRVQQLVEDLLLLARADEALPLTGSAREQVDLDDIVLAEAQRLRESTALRVDTTGVAAVRVVGDPLALQRAVRNVVDNAVRHAVEVVSLSSASTDDGTLALVRVEDDGPGIPSNDRDRVFERFVRLDDARARDLGGSGLGLAIVAEVVRAHGGSVEVGDSSLGGACVELSFSVGSAGT